MQVLIKRDEQKLKESEFYQLLQDAANLRIPKSGDTVKGLVIAVSKNEISIDLPGYKTGVVRGPELVDLGEAYAGLKPGDEVEATVVDLENENGDVELSLRFAGSRKAWESLETTRAAGSLMDATVVEANKGGLMVKVGHMLGFLPVSQLAPEHYPRVGGGEKQKILEKLRTFVGQIFKVKILDISKMEEKLILSEKAVWEDSQRSTLEKFKSGDVIEGEVSAVTDFGAFVRFASGTEAGDLEGLVHISEISWSRVNHPGDLLKVSDRVKCQILNIQGSKIFLSIKRLTEDPWRTVAAKYHVGDVIKGTILKANPFGFFVELDPEIHGLAHISELSDKPIRDPLEVAKIGDVVEWKVISLDPEAHRLGLSLKALKAKPVEEKKDDAVTSES